MTIDTTRLLKAALATLMLGVFAIAVAAPVTLNNGLPAQKAAYAKNGADDGPDAGDDHGGRGGDDGPDAADDNGGHGGDDAPDATGGDDDGTIDQGTGDN